MCNKKEVSSITDKSKKMTKEKCMQISGARAAAGISDNIQKKSGFRQQSVHSKRQYVEVSKENNRIYQLRTIYIKSR